jgi:hypothetical protein
VRRTGLVLGLLLLLLVQAAAAPARTQDDDTYLLALKTVKTNVSDALKLELNALNLATHGNPAGARQEIENSKKLLEGALPAADALTPPLDLSHYVPDNSWERLGQNMRRLVRYDDEALAKPKPSTYYLFLAVQLKQDIVRLVSSHPLCSVLVNDQGGVKVNGQAVGKGQLSVDVACSVKIKELLVETPKNTVTQTAPDGGAKTIEEKSADIVEADLNGAKSGGVTEQTTPDPSPGDSVKIVIEPLVPIVGDSIQYVDEVI